jgi:hypothetical protein
MLKTLPESTKTGSQSAKYNVANAKRYHTCHVRYASIQLVPGSLANQFPYNLILTAERTTGPVQQSDKIAAGGDLSYSLAF